MGNKKKKGGPHLFQGRKEAPEWSQVLKIDNSTKVKCKTCSLDISNKIERIREHLKKCKPLLSESTESSDVIIEDTEDIPETAEPSQEIIEDLSSSASKENDQYNQPGPSGIKGKAGLTGITKNTKQTTLTPFNPAKRPVPTSEGSVASPPAKKTKIVHCVQPTLSEFSVKTSNNLKHTLDVAVAKFFYANKIPHLVANNEHFLNLINLLRPGYKPPCDKDLSNKLLEEVHSEVEKKIENEVKKDNATLNFNVDGWTSVNSKPISAVTVQVDQTPYLVSAKDAGSQTKDADFCVNEVREAHKKVKEKYGKEVSRGGG